MPHSRNRREVKIRVHDGVEIAVALYMPEGDGPFPVLLAPSPYRYDNNSLPATPQFLWRETGPIELYVERGYVYAHMDVRGCGKSGGEFRLLDQQRAEGSLRRRRMARPPILVERQSRRHRPILFLHAAMVDGDPETAGARLHRRLRRAERSLSRLGLSGRHARAISSAAIGGTRTASSTAIRRTASIRASRPAISICCCSSIRPMTISGASAAPPSSSTRSRCRFIRSASGARSICIPAAISTASAAPGARRN